MDQAEMSLLYILLILLAILIVAAVIYWSLPITYCSKCQRAGAIIELGDAPLCMACWEKLEAERNTEEPET